MTRERAELLTLHLLDNDSVIVTSTGEIYINSSYETLKKHADKHKIKLFVIKPPKDFKKSKNE